MIILLIRTAQLEGALNGITYYLKPDWDKLTDMTVSNIFYIEDVHM